MKARFLIWRLRALPIQGGELRDGRDAAAGHPSTPAGAVPSPSAPVAALTSMHDDAAACPAVHTERPGVSLDCAK
jgi:hypothetical protein